jgi:hypothetical protein
MARRGKVGQCGKGPDVKVYWKRGSKHQKRDPNINAEGKAIQQASVSI